MIIEIAEKRDLEEILAIQKLSFWSEGELYDDFSLPPLLQTLDEIMADFDSQLFLKAVTEGEIVGSVRGYMRNGICYVGRLVVRPDFQGRGIGTRLMDEIERRFSDAERYEVFTGYLSEKPLQLYEKRGYERFRTEKINSRLTLVYLKKE